MDTSCGSSCSSSSSSSGSGGGSDGDGSGGVYTSSSTGTTSSGNGTDDSVSGQGSCTDAFRATEKCIKEFVADHQNNILNNNKKRKGKRKVAPAQSTIGTGFRTQDIINVHNYEVVPDQRVQLLESFPVSSNYSELASNVNSTAKIFSINCSAGGFYIVRSALDVDAQIYWASKALTNYSNSVHTNLSNLNGQYGAAVRTTDQLSTEDMTSEEHSSGGKVTGPEEDLWTVSVCENNGFAKFKKLRWANLGYHYNWTLRKYVQHEKSLFPAEFAKLCKQAAGLVSLDINPEAGIVNYYPRGTQMCGHIDDAEHCMDEPIVSFSVGCSCIFLLGGTSKDAVPVPILLRSGDCVIMSGQSRCCYHGVPVILSRELELSLFGEHCKLDSVIDHTEELEKVSSASTVHVLRYLRSARANFNARRVTSQEGAWLEKHGSGYQES
jgi:DNA alkylation damage repair protein AlkB